MIKSMRQFALFVLLIAGVTFTHGQSLDTGNQTGFPNNVSFSGSNFDSVALNNGNLHIDIPLFSVKQRGNRTTSWHFVYDTPTWTLTYYPPVGSAPGYWVVNPAAADGSANGRIVESDGTYGVIWRDSSITCYYGTVQGPVYVDVAVRSDFSLLDPDGTKHPVALRTEAQPPSGYSYNPPCEGQQLTGVTTDGSGYKVDITSSITQPTIWAKDGTRVAPSWTDTNGNYAETLERTPAVVHGANYETWTFKNSNGVDETFRFDYASVDAITQACQFKQTSDACTELNGGSAGGFFPSKITLPNGLYYQFNWVTNGMQDLQSVALPTGAVISYGYETHWFGNHYNWRDGNPYNVRRCVNSRTVASDGHTHQWTYSGYVNGNPTTNVTTVIDPLGNEEDHTYAVVGAAADITAETQVVKKWKDPSTGTLKTLETIDKHYASEIDPDTNMSINQRETCEGVTLDDGTVRKTETDYETFPASFGPLGKAYTGMRLNPIERREYDFGTTCGSSAQPLRRTDYGYWHQSNSGYADATHNIVDRVSSVQVYDSQGLAASTTTSYDTTPISTASGVAEHDPSYTTSTTIRGNPTQIGRWRNTDNSYLYTNNYFDEVGNLRQTTDPGQHNTGFDYTDLWSQSSCIPASGSAEAYVTTVTDGLGHQTVNHYNSCTGSLGSTRDSNNQTTSFTYDFFDRLQSTQFPDGGQISDSPNDALPYTVARTVLANPNPPITSTAQYDGMGRLSETLVTGESPNDRADTSYDALGRVYSVSNLYRPGVASPTDGDVYHQYDSLSRPTILTEQDGSAVSVTYAGSSRTITDETLNQRKMYNDALGRLVEVDEPSPIVVHPATQSSGYVDFGGQSGASLSRARAGPRQRRAYRSVARSSRFTFVFPRTVGVADATPICRTPSTITARFPLR